MQRFLSSFVFVFVMICQLAVLSSCKKDSNSPSNPDLATVSTDRVESIEVYSASVVSTVSKEGKSAVTGMGIAYGKNPNPTVVADKKVPYTNFGVGTFSTYLADLESGTTYYVRAYANNATGTAYGNQLSFSTTEVSGIFNTSLIYGTISDIEGNTYKTIKIGNQTWMAENLKTTKYRNGDVIPTNLSYANWQASTSGAYAIHNSDASNIYGKLYNWYAVTDSRNLCPVGWHIPSDAEWTTLESFLGGSDIAGGKLKSTSSLWIAPNNGVSNESGFSGLPGGIRNSEGSYVDIGEYGNWWSSTEYSPVVYAHYIYLSNFNGKTGRFTSLKTKGYSVRCIKD